MTNDKQTPDSKKEIERLDKSIINHFLREIELIKELNEWHRYFKTIEKLYEHINKCEFLKK